jgi:hypothetical protein
MASCYLYTCEIAAITIRGRVEQANTAKTTGDGSENCVDNADKNFARTSSQSYQQLRGFWRSVFPLLRRMRELKGSSEQSLLIRLLSFARIEAEKVFVMR